MNKLLASQRRWIVLILLLEMVSSVTLFTLSLFFTKFDYYFYIAIALTVFFALVDGIFALSYNIAFRKRKGKADLKASSILGNDINEAYNFGEIGLAVCGPEDEVIWANDFLTDRFPNLLDENIYRVFNFDRDSLIKSNEQRNGAHIKISKENRAYEVELIPEANLFLFKDVTDFTTVYEYNRNQSPVVGYIAIDNYSDIQMHISDDTKFAEMQSGVNDMIMKFASDHNALLRRIKDDRYLFIMTKENYESIETDKFSIVDAVKKKYPRGFTLSLGVALGFPDYAKLASMASSALDVALSRGGDQAVVDRHGEALKYYGGKTDLAPSRNRVTTRPLSNSFVTILKNYRNVVIMGHKTADFDAVAASLGVYALCKSVSIPARICYEDQLVEDKARRAIECEFKKEEFDQIFVTMRELDSLIHEETLLVMVDHSNPTISIFEAYVKKFSHIAVIDHHRPGNQIISNPVFEDIDTSASSASEIITSFITYNPNNIPLDERTATFLLAGICLDTHFYHEHATNSTFEASAQLKNFDADSLKVVEFLKEDLEEYRQKISILDNGETPVTDVYITVSPDEEIVSEITLSRVADESISIRGIQAAFCIGRINPHVVKVSARSDGSINCAAIMEKMHGGGRFVMAATTLQDVTVDEVKAQLKEVLKDYLDDARISTPGK